MNKNQTLSAIESDTNVMTFETTISDQWWLSANKTGISEDAKGKLERDLDIINNTYVKETNA